MRDGMEIVADIRALEEQTFVLDQEAAEYRQRITEIQFKRDPILAKLAHLRDELREVIQTEKAEQTSGGLRD